MDITGYVFLAFGVLILYGALREQVSLNTAIPPETKPDPVTDPKNVMGRLRKRQQSAINPWWVIALILLLVGTALVFLSKL